MEGLLDRLLGGLWSSMIDVLLARLKIATSQVYALESSLSCHSIPEIFVRTSVSTTTVFVLRSDLLIDEPKRVNMPGKHAQNGLLLSPGVIMISNIVEANASRTERPHMSEIMTCERLLFYERCEVLTRHMLINKSHEHPVIIATIYNQQDASKARSRELKLDQVHVA